MIETTTSYFVRIFFSAAGHAFLAGCFWAGGYLRLLYIRKQEFEVLFPAEHDHEELTKPWIYLWLLCILSYLATFLVHINWASIILTRFGCEWLIDPPPSLCYVLISDITLLDVSSIAIQLLYFFVFTIIFRWYFIRRK